MKSENKSPGYLNHVGFIPDGNRRYARRHDLPLASGHELGANRAEDAITWCIERGIMEITLYLFSTDNFSRSTGELRHLFRIIRRFLDSLINDNRIHDEEIDVRIIGNVERLPPAIRAASREAESVTEMYDEFRLNLALAYSGRSALLEAAKSVLEEVDSKDIDPLEIDESMLRKELYDVEVSEIDLLIRTSGEKRTSDFFPWFCVGSEATFCSFEKYWPEITESDLDAAIEQHDGTQ